jgi:hypothetical protein
VFVFNSASVITLLPISVPFTLNTTLPVGIGVVMFLVLDMLTFAVKVTLSPLETVALSLSEVKLITSTVNLPSLLYVPSCCREPTPNIMQFLKSGAVTFVALLSVD